MSKGINKIKPFIRLGTPCIWMDGDDTRDKFIRVISSKPEFEIPRSLRRTKLGIMEKVISQ